MKPNHTLIIAEAGVNHNGSMDLARELIDCAATAGADIVKFQSFRADQLVVASAPKADYQKANTANAESQFEMLKKLELSESMHFDLQAHARKRGIEFLSTPFDTQGIEFLSQKIRVARLKIPSGEITNAPFLLKAAHAGLPIVLSSGMSTLEEIETALAVLAFGFAHPAESPSMEKILKCFPDPAARKLVRDKVIILHCTTEYPAPFADVNLRAMDTIRDRFGVRVGYSDHTPGISVAIAAVARGAAVIEKHFTMDRKLPGPDHKASLEPQELAAMVKAIREVELSIGDGTKQPAASEMKNLRIARKSLVAIAAIREGEIFTEKNLGIKRPGGGVSPLRYWEILGSAAERDYSADDLI